LTKFQLALSKLQVSQLIQKSWEFLYTCIANQLSLDKIAVFNPVLQLYFTTKKVKKTNSDRLAAANRLVKKILAYYKSRNTTKATEDKTDNLYLDIYIYIRTRVIFTTNL
jgi:hypothetical protein